jgi:hypothetical protein
MPHIVETIMMRVQSRHLHNQKVQSQRAFGWLRGWRWKGRW